MFFGLLIPVAKTPFPAALAIALRTNVPIAVASTPVSILVTFGPVDFGARRLGKVAMEEVAPTDMEIESKLLAARAEAPEIEGLGSNLRHGCQRLSIVGQPLVLGFAIAASLSGLGFNFLANSL